MEVSKANPTIQVSHAAAVLLPPTVELDLNAFIAKLRHDDLVVRAGRGPLEEAELSA